MIDELITLRKEVDDIDQQLMQLVKRRVELMKKIGEVKKRSSISITDSEREEEKIKTIHLLAEKLHVPKNLVQKIWESFFYIAREIEK